MVSSSQSETGGGRTQNGIHLVDRTANLQHRERGKRCIENQVKIIFQPDFVAAAAPPLSVMMMINIQHLLDQHEYRLGLLVSKPGGDDIALIIIYLDGSVEIKASPAVAVTTNKSRRL